MWQSNLGKTPLDKWIFSKNFCFQMCSLMPTPSVERPQRSFRWSQGPELGYAHPSNYFRIVSTLSQLNVKIMNKHFEKFGSLISLTKMLFVFFSIYYEINTCSPMHSTWWLISYKIQLCFAIKQPKMPEFFFDTFEAWPDFLTVLTYFVPVVTHFFKFLQD